MRKLTAAVWPEKGFDRPIRYYALRILRLRASPHNIAAGVAAGVGPSFTPFVGLHFFLSFGLAWILRGSLIASAIGSILSGNPITWPIIWVATWKIGNMILGLGGAATSSIPNLQEIFDNFSFMEVSGLMVNLWRPVFEPMLIGAIPLGLSFSLAAYGLTFYAATMFQSRRKERMEARARRLSLTEIDPTEI